jgi:hypothetical protein
MVGVISPAMEWCGAAIVMLTDSLIDERFSKGSDQS